MVVELQKDDFLRKLGNKLGVRKTAIVAQVILDECLSSGGDEQWLS